MNVEIHTSHIDKSLQDLDALIERKRAHLRQLDSARKLRPPVSFVMTTTSVTPSPVGHSHRSPAPLDLSAASSLSGTIKSNKNNAFSVVSASAPKASRTPLKVLELRREGHPVGVSMNLGSELGSFSADAALGKENMHGNVTVTPTQQQLRAPLGVAVSLSAQKLALQAQAQAQADAQAQAQMQADAQTQALAQAQAQAQMQAQAQAEMQAPLPPQPAPNGALAETEAEAEAAIGANESDLVVESITAALYRIEELEGDRSDYAACVQRLDGEKKELSMVLDAQRAVIDTLSTQKSKMQQQQQLREEEDRRDGLRRATTARQQVRFNQETTEMMAETDSNTGNTGPASANKRRLVHRGGCTPSSTSSGSATRYRSNSVTTPSSSSEADEEAYEYEYEDGEEAGQSQQEPSPFFLAKLSPELRSPDAPSEHRTLVTSTSSPSSIYIIRSRPGTSPLLLPSPSRSPHSSGSDSALASPASPVPVGSSVHAHMPPTPAPPAAIPSATATPAAESTATATATAIATSPSHTADTSAAKAVISTLSQVEEWQVHVFGGVFAGIVLAYVLSVLHSLAYTQ